MTTLVLCKSIREAQAYGRDTGEKVRFASNAGAVKGFQPSKIVEASSYMGRPDRHAINAALKPILRRHGDLNVTYIGDIDASPRPVEHEGELPGQISFDDIEWKSPAACTKVEVDAFIEKTRDAVAFINDAEITLEISEPPVGESAFQRVANELADIVQPGDNDPPEKPARKPRAKKASANGPTVHKIDPTAVVPEGPSEEPQAAFPVPKVKDPFDWDNL